MTSNIIITALLPALTFIWTISWTIVQDKKAKYKSFIDKKDEKVLENILLPFYERIELNLYVKITEQNKQEIFNNITDLLTHLQKEKLLFYIGSEMSSILIQLQNEINKEKINLNKINNFFKTFSNQYLTMSWNVRKNLKIEKIKYDYIKNNKINVPYARMDHYLLFTTTIKYFFIFCTFMLYIFVIIYKMINLKSFAIELFVSSIILFLPIYYISLFIVPLIFKLVINTKHNIILFF